MIKSTAWNWFSKYIRLRDCLETTGNKDYCKCITCGRIKHVSEIQAGHGIGGRGNGILFDEEVTHGQCVYCNWHLKGNYEMYITVLIEKRGAEWYEQKKIKSKLPCKIDLKEESKKWRLRYNELNGIS